MQWSKLKQNIEGKLAESVKGRVKIFSTHYNKPTTISGRGWITNTASSASIPSF
jgi:hypothetical protein